MLAITAPLGCSIQSAHPVNQSISFVESSANVFEDLGLSKPEQRRAKAELSRVIRQIIADRGWTQRKAASVLDIGPSDMSDLIRGKLRRFSQERLERFLNALDMDVRIQVAPRPAWKEGAGVPVRLLQAFWYSDSK